MKPKHLQCHAGAQRRAHRTFNKSFPWVSYYLSDWQFVAMIRRKKNCSTARKSADDCLPACKKCMTEKQKLCKCFMRKQKHSTHLLDFNDHNAFCNNVDVMCKSGLLLHIIIHAKPCDIWLLHLTFPQGKCSDAVTWLVGYLTCWVMKKQTFLPGFFIRKQLIIIIIIIIIIMQINPPLVIMISVIHRLCEWKKLGTEQFPYKCYLYWLLIEIK